MVEVIVEVIVEVVLEVVGWVTLISNVRKSRITMMKPCSRFE